MVVLQLVKTSVGATWAYRQMKELVKLGVVVHVAMPINGLLYQKYLESGVIVHEVDFSLSTLLRSCFSLRRLVTQVKPDIIHSHFVITTVIMRLALYNIKIPRIFQVPGPLHLENYVFRKLEILIARKNIDFWIGTCRWTNKCYEANGVDKERLYLSYYGSDLNFIKKQKGILKSSLGLSCDSFVVGMVAYMYAPKWYLGQRGGLKGHEDFIDALALLLNKYPNLYGVCIGGAWNNALSYERKILRYARMKCGDRLVFLGNRTDVPALYGDMDLVIHPSHSENLGGAAESLLLEVPTITTDVGGFPDIIINNETGILVPSGQPKDIAEAIELVMNGKIDIDSFKIEGKKIAESLLNIKNNAKEILHIYTEVKRLCIRNL